MLHNVHKFQRGNVVNYYVIIMKVHGIFNKSSERNVNSIKSADWHKLSFVLYPEAWSNFLNFPVPLDFVIVDLDGFFVGFLVKSDSGDDIMDKI
jgi:hypothetical protein